MQCTNCKIEVSSTFTHAISLNQCPACGGEIMDQEVMAMVLDVENTISSVARLREDASHELAMVLVAKYNMVGKVSSGHTEHKIAAPSAAQQISKKTTETIDISKLDEMDISEEEREKLMEEVIKDKFNMTDGGITSMANNPEEIQADIVSSGEANQLSTALFDDTGVLKEERMLRLAKQRQAMNSGSGSFRRGS